MKKISLCILVIFMGMCLVFTGCSNPAAGMNDILNQYMEAGPSGAEPKAGTNNSSDTDPSDTDPADNGSDNESNAGEENNGDDDGAGGDMTGGSGNDIDNDNDCDNDNEGNNGNGNNGNGNKGSGNNGNGNGPGWNNGNNGNNKNGKGNNGNGNNGNGSNGNGSGNGNGNGSDRNNGNHRNNKNDKGDNGNENNGGNGNTGKVTELEAEAGMYSVAFDGWKHDWEFMSGDVAMAMVSVDKVNNGGNPIISIEALDGNKLTSVQIVYALNKAKFNKGEVTIVELEITDEYAMDYIIEKSGSPYVVVTVGLN